MAMSLQKLSMGLTLIERSAGRALLSAGADDEVDLILTGEGGRTGAAGFTLSVDSDEDLETLARRLVEAGVAFDRASNPLPGLARTLSFDLPSGHRIALALPSKFKERVHSGRDLQTREQGWAVIDLDHITLRIDNGISRTMDFLRDIVGLQISDILMQPDGQAPMACWMRAGTYHHDVAMFAGHPGETLDHLAWTVANMEDIKMLFDNLARRALKTEAGPGRHGVGGNIYGYFHTPGGNRYELSAEMPRIPNQLEKPGIWTDLSTAFSVWGAPPPESFKWGS